jgi:hypothetical protein
MKSIWHTDPTPDTIQHVTVTSLLLPQHGRRIWRLKAKNQTSQTNECYEYRYLVPTVLRWGHCTVLQYVLLHQYTTKWPSMWNNSIHVLIPAWTLRMTSKVDSAKMTSSIYFAIEQQTTDQRRRKCIHVIRISSKGILKAWIVFSLYFFCPQQATYSG